MATTMYLIRENRQFVQYTGVVGSAELTGVASYFTTVTGTASNDTLTIPNNTLADGQPVYFQSLAGGSGLSTNTTLWVVNTSGNDLQLALTPGGAAIDFVTDITSAVLVAPFNDMFVWSAEYRDQFQTTMRQVPTGGNTPSGEIIAPALIGELGTTTGGGSSATTPTFDELSDEVSHAPLRQSPIKTTFWRFNIGTLVEPIYTFAQFMEGDAIANNPPNRVVAVTP